MLFMLRLPRTSVWIYPTFFLLLFLPEWIEFFKLWYEGTIYAHGFLVLIAVTVLLFKVREGLDSLEVNPSWLGFLALCFFSIVMLLSKSADIKTIRLLCIPFLITSWGWAIYGPRFLKLAGVPIGLLIFASPIWDDMSPIFQAITVFVNSLLLQVVGIPADIHELYITIPAGTFFVAGGCSGVRYLMVGLFLAPLYGFLYLPGYKRSLILTVFAALLSMLANWIRVFGIIVIGHVTDMQSSIIEDHEAFGWLTFLAICLVPLFFIARRLEPEANNPTPLELRIQSAVDQEATSLGSRSLSYRPALFASVIVLLVPVTFYSQTVIFEDSNNDWSPSLPVAGEQWRGPLRFATIWSPSFVNPDISAAGTYVSEQLQQVQFQIEAYRQQKQGKELIYYKNNLYDEAEWSLLNQSVVSAPRQNGFGIDRVKETQLVSLEDGRSVLLWSWYRLGDLASASRIEIKLYGGLRGLSGRSNGSFLAIAAECEGRESPDCTEARQSLIRFMSETEYSQ